MSAHQRITPIGAGRSISRRLALRTGGLAAIGAGVAAVARPAASAEASPPGDQPLGALLPMLCHAAAPAANTAATLADLLAHERAAFAEYERVSALLAERVDAETLELVRDVEECATDQLFFSQRLVNELVLAHLGGLAPMLRMLRDHAGEEGYYALCEGRTCCTAVEGVSRG